MVAGSTATVAPKQGHGGISTGGRSGVPTDLGAA